MTDAEKIAGGLTREAAVSLMHGCSCGHSQELVDAGLWAPEFPKKYKQEYFRLTPLGLQVRAILERGGVSARKRLVPLDEVRAMTDAILNGETK